MRTFGRYLFIQILGWAAVVLVLLFLTGAIGLPIWAATAVFIVWVIKDLAIYPIVRRAYERDSQTGAERMVGKRGVAQEALAPEGYIKIEGELWRARTQAKGPSIPRNRTVTVTGARGLILTVEENEREGT